MELINRPLNFRLRPDKDEDIARALEKATEKEDRSDIIRAALRSYLLENSIQRRPGKRLNKADLAGTELKKREKTEKEIENSLDNLLDDY